MKNALAQSGALQMEAASDNDDAIDFDDMFDNDEKLRADQSRSKKEKSQCPSGPSDLKTDVVIRLGEMDTVIPGESFAYSDGAISGRIWRGSLAVAVYLMQRHQEWFQGGKSVLELGCGRALVGLVLAANGCEKMTLTDCDDRALSSLIKALPDDTSIDVRHFLWECDMLENLGRQVHHWSDADRDDSILALSEDSAFDLVIAAECLYVPPQELSLAAVLARRIRKPNGVCIACSQERGSASSEFSQARLTANLKELGLKSRRVDESFNLEELLDLYVRCVAGQETMRFCGGSEETGKCNIMIISWDEECI